MTSTNDPTPSLDETLPRSGSGDMPFEELGMPPVPDQIDGFRIVGLMASGGMGAVYEAVQEDPRRRVALKMIRPGLATKALLSRFQFEAQTLARLRHPNIAQIYQTGTWESPSGALPYFAMEYIPNATSLTHYANTNNLSLRDRLVLFMKVCGAVHHGHLRGIVHRDLKPGNILVGGNGEPKLIDFGVARATDSDQAAVTQMTNVGQLIGTIQYMSPEQCDADPDDIDARSDVYTLGVVLYELLSNHLPYDMKEAALHEMVRVIKQDEPTRLSSLEAQFAGDVETIAKKALEKTRDRRYQSALELRSDIGRFLDDEPILARPASRIYLIRKFAKRHRALVACSLSITALILGSLIWTSVTLSIIYKQQTRLRAVNDDLVSSIYTASKLGGDIYERLLVMDASIDVRRAIADLVQERSDAIYHLIEGQNLDSETHPVFEMVREARIRARIDVGDVLGGSRGAYSNLGRPLDAQQLYEEAAEINDLWLDEDPMYVVPTLLHMQILTRKGDVRYLAGTPEQAQPLYSEIVDYGRMLLDNDAAMFQHIRVMYQASLRLADCHAEAGRLDEMLKSVKSARSILEQNIDDLNAYGVRRDLALISRREGYAVYEQVSAIEGEETARDQARPHYESSLQNFSDLAAAAPASGRAQRDLAWARYYLAYLEAGGGDEVRGRSELADGAILLMEYLRRNPEDADARRDIPLYLTQVVALEPYLGGEPLARETIDKCNALLQSMIEQRPQDSQLERLATEIAKMHPTSDAMNAN